MKKNGFIIEGTAAIIFLISAATLAIFTLTPAKNLIKIGGDGSKSVQSQSYKETIEPVMENGEPVKVKLADGSEGLIFKRTKSSNTLDEQTHPKLTIWQKIKQIGWWWLALSIGAMFIPALGFMNTINSKAKNAALALVDKIKADHANLKSEAQRIVLSVDEGLNVFDTAIKAAQAMIDAETASMATITDPAILAVHQTAILRYQAVLKALMDTKKAFLDALKTKQDESTKLLVPQLRNGT